MTTFAIFDGQRLSDMRDGGGFAIFNADIREAADHLVVVLARHRESEAIDLSNFRYGLVQFGMIGYGENNAEMERSSNENETVTVQGYGHPLVGWIEYLVVDDRDPDAASIARKIMEDIEGYPILDEDDFSMREEDEKTEYVESETSSMTGNMPDDTTGEERSRAAWYGRERHEQTGGPVADYDTEANFAYGVARVMLKKGYSDDEIIAAMSCPNNIRYPDTPQSIIEEARKDNAQENA